MIKKTISLLGILFVCYLLISATLQKSSSGAPASHTGAPGEKTCAASGCHDDHALNSGTAVLNVTVLNADSAAEHNKLYTIEIGIEDKDVERFGFQVVALTENTLQNAGVFEITDTYRTQLLTNRYELKDRQYVTYTFNGTDAVRKGKGYWQVKWKAPEKIKENIVFYVAAVSGNDDMHDSGDYTYTARYQLKNKN